MATFSDVNPFGNLNFMGMGTLASILIIFALATIIIGIIGAFIFIRHLKKVYNIKIHLFRLIGNVPTRVAIYSAREKTLGITGDALWRVSDAGWNKIKTVKWLSVGRIQTAPREFWYWKRPDGEWENFCLSDIDEIQKKAGVKLIQEDMRLQRIATEKILEQRHMQKGFWDKWGNTIMTLVFFLVIAVCMVIIFYQFSKLIDKLMPLVNAITESLKIVQKTCPIFYNESVNGGTGVVPLVPVG